MAIIIKMKLDCTGLVILLKQQLQKLVDLEVKNIMKKSVERIQSCVK